MARGWWFIGILFPVWWKLLACSVEGRLIKIIKSELAFGWIPDVKQHEYKPCTKSYLLKQTRLVLIRSRDHDSTVEDSTSKGVPSKWVSMWQIGGPSLQTYPGSMMGHEALCDQCKWILWRFLSSQLPWMRGPQTQLNALGQVRAS